MLKTRHAFKFWNIKSIIPTRLALQKKPFFKVKIKSNLVVPILHADGGAISPLSGIVCGLLRRFQFKKM